MLGTQSPESFFTFVREICSQIDSKLQKMKKKKTFNRVVNVSQLNKFSMFPSSRDCV